MAEVWVPTRSLRSSLRGLAWWLKWLERSAPNAQLPGSIPTWASDPRSLQLRLRTSALPGAGLLWAAREVGVSCQWAAVCCCRLPCAAQTGVGVRGGRKGKKQKELEKEKRNPMNIKSLKFYIIPDSQLILITMCRQYFTWLYLMCIYYFDFIFKWFYIHIFIWKSSPSIIVLVVI